MRLFAERNSVIRDGRPDNLAKLPTPAAVEYPLPLEKQHEQVVTAPVGAGVQAQPTVLPPTPLVGVEMEFEGALRSIANEDYEPARAITVEKTLADFEWTFNPKIPKTKIVESASARFVAKARGVLLIELSPASAHGRSRRLRPWTLPGAVDAQNAPTAPWKSVRDSTSAHSHPHSFGKDEDPRRGHCCRGSKLR